MKTATKADPLTVTQVGASRALGVSDRTLRRWEQKGMISSTKVGGVRLYPFKQLKALALGTKSKE